MKSKHPEYREKFEQKKAKIMKIRADDSSCWQPLTTSGPLQTFDIGEAKVDFNVNVSPLFSHNFYRKGNRKDLAECLMCGLSGIKTLLKITDGSTKGRFSTYSTFIISK